MKVSHFLYTFSLKIAFLTYVYPNVDTQAAKYIRKTYDVR